MNPLIQLKTTPPLLITLALLCSGFLPRAQAVVPAPDGGYPGGNTAEGQNALLSLNVNTGTNNTAIGWFSLRSNVEGQFNTALGAGTLVNNTAHRNTAIGGAAMFSNTTGHFNTAVGMLSLFNNTTGLNNTAIGDGALFNNSTGHFNTAFGVDALRQSMSGFNTAVGANAGVNVINADRVICIGAVGANTSNSCFIGNIWQQPGGSQAVYVNSFGKLGAQVSSARFKDEIKSINQASEAIHRLRPVSFRYKAQVEPTHAVGFGLIAEEVEKINPDLVSRDREGKPLGVRYDAVNAMLLNEFLKEHRKNEEQQKQINVLTAQLKEQAAQIQKVSAQLEASKPAPQMVNNP
jgi:hypothetical protein